jgi:hypothetical protein
VTLDRNASPLQFVPGPPSIPREDQDGPRINGAGRHEIAFAISDDGYAVHGDAIIPGETFEQPGKWLSAVAAVVREMRTIDDPVDRSSERIHCAPQLAVDGLKRAPIQKLAADAGLI